MFTKWERGDGLQFHTFLDDLEAYLTDVPDNERQFQIQSFLYGADPTGMYKGYLDTRDSTNYWNDYFRNTGLSWSDIKYPTRMYGFGNMGSTASRSVNFVSRSIRSLYR